MSTPGIGNPYWYEWYVGIQQIVDMLNPDSQITGVVFQHPEYTTIDDVVVEYNNGSKQMCYQVKHEISPESKINITLGSLLNKDKSTCLLKDIFDGWKKATNNDNSEITPILYSNRKVGSNRTRRTVNGITYISYPADMFFSKISDILNSMGDNEEIVIEDNNLLLQWQETCTAIDEKDIKAIISFFRCFQFRPCQNGLEEIEKSIINQIKHLFDCDDAIAYVLLSRLCFQLRIWTTNRRGESVRVTREDAYEALGEEPDEDNSRHTLAPPYPFFGSRMNFGEKLYEKIMQTDKKVVFLSGEPGSGKTSIISYMQATYDLFYVRYHTFRPISPEQHFYNEDPGFYTSDNLWGTLLSQIRHRMKGKIFQYNVPVSNRMLTTDKKRANVFRLLEAEARIQLEHGKRLYICIDGIDHAARAQQEISFLSSLPAPAEIPEGVCFVLVGQPVNLYRDQYPMWLASDIDIETIQLPVICENDISQLIQAEIPLFRDVADDLAAGIIRYTQGNNLSSVYAVEAIRNAGTLSEALRIINCSGISSDIEQYYKSIWQHCKTLIGRAGIPMIYPDAIIACPLLLMNGRISTDILCKALPYNIDEVSWKMIFDNLYPLVIPCNTEKEYALFHNDFRVFLMRVIRNYETRYKEIAYYIAQYLLDNQVGKETYMLGIPLLITAEKQQEIPTYFNPTFVIGALSHHISHNRLDEYAKQAYDVACRERNFDGLIQVYLSIKCLYQHTRYFEYYLREYHTEDYPELVNTDIAEVKKPEGRINSLDIYNHVMSLCNKLVSMNTKDSINRAHSLYNKWLIDLKPYDIIYLCGDRITEEEYWHLKADDVGLFLSEWGKLAAAMNISLNPIKIPEDGMMQYALYLFGKAYYDFCIETENINSAIDACQKNYVSLDCIVDGLSKLYYKGFSKYFIKALVKIQNDKKEKTQNRLLSIVMQIVSNQDTAIQVDALKPQSKIRKLDFETTMDIVLRSFIHGHCEKYIDDEIVCGHIAKYYQGLDETKEKKLYAIQMACMACLLGKYYWHREVPTATMLRRSISMFFVAPDIDMFSWREAIKFLLFTLLNSPIGDAYASDNQFVEELKTYLSIGSPARTSNTIVLEYLKRHKMWSIIREHILSVYGSDFISINQMEDKLSIHTAFKPYGELVEPDMMERYDHMLQWDVIGYVGDKETALGEASQLFDLLVARDPSQWREIGKKLYSQSKIAELSNNAYDSDIINSLIRASVASGYADYWELRSWGDDFYNDAHVASQIIKEMIEQADDHFGFQLIWLLSSGIHSWYTQEERSSMESIYRICLEKSKTNNVDFGQIVHDLTPGWKTIVDYESKRKYVDIEKYTKKHSDSISSIIEQYDQYHTDELVDLIPLLPMDHSFITKLSRLFEIIINRHEMKEDYAKLFLKYLCISMHGKTWGHNGIDEMVYVILSILGDEAMWDIINNMGESISDYEYWVITNNLEFILLVYSKLNNEFAKKMIEEELLMQNLWVTGNSHLAIAHPVEEHVEQYHAPTSFAELSLLVLFEQLGRKNAREMEAALFALYRFGKHIADGRKMILSRWDELSDYQKDYLLLIVYRWAKEEPDNSDCTTLLLKEYDKCHYLSRLYLLHSILLTLNIEGIKKDAVTCKAQSKEYTYPSYVSITEEHDMTEIERFFVLAKEYGVDNHLIDGIRQYLQENKHVENKEYRRGNLGDMLIPEQDRLTDEVLYCEEKRGSWANIPIIKKKSTIIPQEDPFVFLDIPEIIYNTDWFPDIDMSSSLDDRMLSEISKYGILPNRALLSAYISYPVGHNQYNVWIDTTKVCDIHNLSRSTNIDRCLGNFGLLIYEGKLRESNENSETVCLFNQMGGCIRFHYGNCLMLPSRFWIDVLGCTPSERNPYVWSNENGVPVLWYERYMSPILDNKHEAYIRQPILVRWVCDKKWFLNELENRGLRIWHVNLRKHELY